MENKPTVICVSERDLSMLFGRGKTTFKGIEAEGNLLSNCNEIVVYNDSCVCKAIVEIEEVCKAIVDIEGVKNPSEKMVDIKAKLAFCFT